MFIDRKGSELLPKLLHLGLLMMLWAFRVPYKGKDKRKKVAGKLISPENNYRQQKTTIEQRKVAE